MSVAYMELANMEQINMGTVLIFTNSHSGNYTFAHVSSINPFSSNYFWIVEIITEKAFISLTLYFFVSF